MKNEFLRHTIATINYRFQKAVRNTDDSFGDFNLGKGSRSPNEIINHMYQVLNAANIFLEEERFEKEIPRKLSFTLETGRFNATLKAIDKTLANKALEMDFSKKLLQGPFSDILTHIGQIAMLQRLKGKSIEGEDFSAASIKTGLI